jgi:hypothetical protein
MEKRPAVSAERLTTSSPKRWENSEAGAWTLESLTVVPDQPVLNQGKIMTKPRSARRRFVSFDFLKLIMGSVMRKSILCFGAICKHEFSVWEYFLSI